MEKNFCIRAFEIDCPESVHLSPDGKYVISFGFSDKTMIWELSSGNLINTVDGMKWNAISPDGKYLAGYGQIKRLLIKV